jgi:hypothetical protein
VGRAGAQAETAVPLGIESLFSAGNALQDRNGDGVVDRVDARILLGPSPSAADVAAAAQIAARFGYETMAMDLPFPTSGLRILIGREALQAAGGIAAGAGLAELESGQGMVRSLALGDGRAVVVAGADTPGTGAAAAMLAGRLPYVWASDGPTLSKVASDVKEFLASKDVAVRAVTISAVVVKRDVPGLERIEAGVELSSAGEVAKARTALRALSPARSAEGAALSYPGARSLRVVLSAPRGSPVPVEIAGPSWSPPEGPVPARPGSAAKAELDLSNLYTPNGLLGDSNEDLIPDRLDALLLPFGGGVEGTVEVAARIGLESTGIGVPVALDAASVEKPESQPTLVLIGRDHPLTRKLVDEKKLDLPALEPGQGLLQVVRKAFGEKPALVVTGGDDEGLARACSQLSQRLPHVGERGKDRTTVEDVEEDVRNFLSGRSPAGQAAMALYKLKRIAGELAEKDLESARVSVHVEKAAPGLEDVVRKEAESSIPASSVEVMVENLDVQKAEPLIDEEFEVPSEVDDFWTVFRTRVLRQVKKKRPVVLEARLSEPPEVRKQIEEAARAELLRTGASPNGTSVTVLSAYKQGFSWLYDVVRRALEGKPVDRLTIRFAEIGPPPEWKQQAMYTPTRWLLEIFPIDEVLARELKLDLSKIAFEKTPLGSPTYEVVAASASGEELYRASFEPRWVLRSFFDRFPEYEKVRVTTGWITAKVADQTVADQRIVTDVERFWDHFQGKTLPAMYDNVMAISKGKPRPQDAPFFGELTVHLSLSEPEYELGVDKERISSLEAMHEEIYFNTLHFFDVLGRNARGQGLDYPGRVLPFMEARSDGKPGKAKIRYTGFASSRPAVVVAYREKDGRSGELRRDIARMSIDRPAALAATVRTGRDGIERLDLRLKVDTEKDDWPSLVKRAQRDQVEARILSAEQVTAVLSILGRLRAAGLYRDALAYHDLGGLRVAAGWEHDITTDKQSIAALEPNGAPAPFPDIREALPSGYRYAGGPLVQWDTPIPPAEAKEILAKMSTFEQATTYRVGESYLGKDIWAMDLMPALSASHWSQAKATTLKPTIIYSARQHANEVSSTSHVLRLAELLLTDPEYRKKLDRVNVVIHPITNPDGAQLAYDLYKENPDHMHHAGYLGALGVDMTQRQWDNDAAVYPEAKIRPNLWRTWLPDIFLNPHGYPSHEWVQLFSEYAGWVRNRVTEARDWWGMRGWFTPGFGYLDDPKFPRHKEAAFEIRERFTKNMHAVPEIRELNRRAYDRYRRYGFAHDDENFKLDFANDVLVYTAIKGARSDPRADDFMARQPKVTIWTGGTEAPDETAHGDWMKLVATMGLQWDKAILQYLVDGKHVVERKSEDFHGGVHLSMNRPRPPKKEEAKTPPTESSAQR